MANTYTQLLIHLVFVVQRRENIIEELHREELQKYMTGIFSNRGHKVLSIYCMPDHTHALIGFNPDSSLSQLVQEVKGAASKFINDNKWFRREFNWQRGYGAFSYSKSNLTNVCNYIENQKAHHHKRSFREEYVDFLKKFEIDYDERYIFKELE